MKKRLMSLILIGLLACPNTLVFAQEVTEEDPVESSLVEDTETPTEAPTEEETEEPIPDTSYEPPVTETPTYPDPVTESPTEVEETSATTLEITEETTIEKTIDIDELVAESFSNPTMQKAYLDYQFASETFTYNDEVLPELIGTSLDEVKSTFETYLTENKVEDVATSDEGKIDELGKTKSLTYFYYYPGEEGNESKAIAELKFFFDEDKLTAVSILHHAPIVVSQLTEEDVQALPSQSEPINYLTEKQPTIVGLIQKVSNEYKYKTIITPSKKSDQDIMYFIELYIDKAQVGKEVKSDNKEEVKKYILEYINEKEPTMTLNSEYIEKNKETSTEDSESSEGSEETSEENSNEESEEESDQVSIVESEEESTELSEQVSENNSESEDSSTNNDESNPILAKLPLSFDYDANKLNDQEKLVTGFEKLLKEVQGGNTLELVQIEKELGEPNTVPEGDENKRIYLSVSEEAVIIITVSLDENNEVLSVKNELRDLKVLETFPITVEELFAIGEEEETIIQDLSQTVGNPTIVDIQNDKQIVRFVWTRLKDENIKNIEVEQNIAEGSQSMMYYEP